MSWATPQSGATISTRRAKPSHEQWQPHEYQRRAVQFLRERGAAALFLDPGLGKTSIVLQVFSDLLTAGVARRMLVVAPLRVCQTVWRQEGQKWTQFRDLRFSLLHGARKADRLRDDSDIWLVNPEGMAWLCRLFPGRTLPWDTVVLDELTKFKHHDTERFKALRPRLKGVARRWGLTGTPAPNGYQDLFGQMLMLDDGAALGRFVTHFRAQYFQVGFNGFDYDLLPGAEKRIETAIAPYVLRMSAEEWLELPPIVEDVRELEMQPAARKTYDKMRKEMLAELPEGTVTGANSAAVYSKLKQMANGAVYAGDNGAAVAHIHDTKLEALEELVEELAGQQLLIAYEFRHDADRLVKHFGDKLTLLSGQSEKRTAEIVEAWNRGEIQLLACHPASAAHGLNLQQSNCAHVAWFSPIWDLELWQQFIRRVRRQGNEAQHIVNHVLCIKGTIDELALEALRDKDVTQSRLLMSLGAVLGAEKETTEMSVAKLSRPSFGHGGQPAPQPDSTVSAQSAGANAQSRKIIPRGWAQPAGELEGSIAAGGAKTEQRDIADQRERIAAKLTGEPIPMGGQHIVIEPKGVPDPTREAEHNETLADRTRAAFGVGVEQKREAIEQAVEVLTQENKLERPRITREGRRAEPEGAQPDPVPSGVNPEQRRAAALQVALTKCESIKDAIELAREIVEFLENG